MPHKDEAATNHLTLTFSCLTPGSPGCPLGITFQVAGSLISFLRAAPGPLPCWWLSQGGGRPGPHQAACDSGAPHSIGANDDHWGPAYAPEEGVLLPIHPRVKGQSRVFTKRRDDDGKHQSQKHKSGWEHNLWGNKHGNMGCGLWCKRYTNLHMRALTHMFILLNV